MVASTVVSVVEVVVDELVVVVDELVVVVDLVVVVLELVVDVAEVPRSGAGQRPAGDLRPLERRVLKWRAGGASLADVASRFRRSPRSIEQIERLANYKQNS